MSQSDGSKTQVSDEAAGSSSPLLSVSNPSPTSPTQGTTSTTVLLTPAVMSHPPMTTKTAQDEANQHTEVQIMAPDNEQALNQGLSRKSEAPATSQEYEDDNDTEGEEEMPKISLPAPSQCTCGSRTRRRTPQDLFEPIIGSFEQRAEGMIATFFGHD